MIEPKIMFFTAFCVFSLLKSEVLKKVIFDDFGTYFDDIKQG